MNRALVIAVIAGTIILVLMLDNYRLSGSLFQVEQLTDGELHHETIEVGVGALAVAALL